MIVIYITRDNLVSSEITDQSPIPCIKRACVNSLSAKVTKELGEYTGEHICREYELIAHNGRVLVYQEKGAALD